MRARAFVIGIAGLVLLGIHPERANAQNNTQCYVITERVERVSIDQKHILCASPTLGDPGCTIRFYSLADRVNEGYAPEVLVCDMASHVLFFLSLQEDGAALTTLKYVELGRDAIYGWCFDNDHSRKPSDAAKVNDAFGRRCHITGNRE